MSHFTVMVQIPSEVMNGEESVHEYIHYMLAPYDENLEVTAYIRYSRADILAKYEEVKEKFPEDKYDEMPMEQFVEDWFGCELDDEGNGLSKYNPKSKWDWWTIGGRWGEMLRLKNGEAVDLAPVGEIDFDGIVEDNRQRRAKAWEEAYKDGKPDDFILSMCGINSNSRKAHLDGAKGLSTFAVITKSGEWCAKGAMGFWGQHSATEEEEQEWEDTFYLYFIHPLDEEDGIVIIDCHI